MSFAFKSPASRWRARPAPRRCAPYQEEHLHGVTKNAALDWKLRDHGLFIAFAPVAQPKYACACIVEHGSDGHPQVLMARDILLFTQKRDPVGRPAVAIYPSHTAAEAAIKELQQSGFDMKKLSIVGRDYHTDEHVVGYYNAGDRMKVWGKTGAFWGGLWGLLFGSAFFWVPGLGPLLVAGPLVSWIIGALEGAVWWAV